MGKLFVDSYNLSLRRDFNSFHRIVENPVEVVEPSGSGGLARMTQRNMEKKCPEILPGAQKKKP